MRASLVLWALPLLIAPGCQLPEALTPAAAPSAPSSAQPPTEDPGFSRGPATLKLRGMGGESLGQADLAQGTTVIVVWTSWSPRGGDVHLRVNALKDRWGSQARVVSVNFQEDRATIEDFLAGKGLAVPVFLDSDGAFSKHYATTTLPGLLVIKDGATAYRGRLPEDPDSILAELL